MGAEATQISAFTTAAAHTVCFVGLAVAHSLAGRGVLVSDPTLALRLLVFLKAAARGLLGLPIGAFLNAFGAVALGAPVGIKFWTATIYWSLLMSLFTENSALTSESRADDEADLLSAGCATTGYMSLASISLIGEVGARAQL
ncbi:hypothetical protein ACQ4PT_020643 [Festuca glaucescens]